MENKNTQTTSGDDLSKYVKDNDVLLKGIVMWLLLPLIGPLFFLNDSNELVRFNAKQSLYVALVEIVLGIILSFLSIFMIPLFFLTFGLISILLIPISIVPIVLHVYMVYKMNKGEKVYLPYIGKLSE